MENDHLHDIFEIVKDKKNKSEDIIQLNVGEPEIDPPGDSIQALIKSLDNKRYKYGPAAGDKKFLEVLAARHGVESKNVIVGPGSKFLIYAYLKTIINSSADEVIIPTPYWHTYTKMLTDLGVKKINYLPTTLEEGWHLKKEQLEKHLNKNTKCIILTSPNNPTSTLIDQDLVIWILSTAREKNIKVLLDFAYKDLVFSQKDEIEPDFSDLNHAAYAFTFSKSFSMTGFRLGYLITNESNVEKLKEYNQITVTNVPLFIQDSGLGALKDSDAFIKRIRKVYQQRADLVSGMLEENDIEFSKPQAGIYIFPKIRQDSEKLAYKLLDKGVAVVPGTAFGRYREFIRISLTETEERLVKGVKTIIQELRRS